MSLLIPAVLLAGCAQTPMGPLVQVMPGPRKSFDAFQADRAVCTQDANAQVAGQAKAANDQAVGGAVLATVLGAGLGAAVGGGRGAAAGAGIGAGLGAAGGAGASGGAQGAIQAQFDNAFASCMYSKGNQVPGYATLVPDPNYRPAALGPDPALVRSVQSELIRLNYLPGGADGQMGPRTISAVRSFERSSGMAANGAVSPRLLARLQSTPSSQAASSAPAPDASAGWVAPTSTAASAGPPPGWVAPQ